MNSLVGDLECFDSIVPRLLLEGLSLWVPHRHKGKPHVALKLAQVFSICFLISPSDLVDLIQGGFSPFAARRQAPERLIGVPEVLRVLSHEVIDRTDKL